ncbi:MAG: hypothetical protein AAF996_09180 [Pseudomonadota bacterium]
MKRALITIAVAAILGGCWGAPPNEQILDQQCQDLFGDDARTLGMIKNQAESDLAGFCGCYASKTVQANGLIDKHKDMLVTMNELKKNGGDVESAAEQIEDMTKDGRITTFTEAEFEALGDFFQELSGEMGSAGGACPA